ncbi:MAG TPA: hypothetical protein VFE18_14260 [Phenylobacterium sp.]|uniref:hypothetical protein n=1 Tax=Phenylobacterium sp. TaxID=1871053 RepID=UPI002D307DA7|nr:hypothetical protein [Phenylobacterium sp.]HZZ69333.1 hypothetical protein [Phenylobacterium sp.]
MDEITRLLAMLGVAGVVVTALAGIARWRMNEGRRVRRGLKVVLKGQPHGFLVAFGRGRGMGFNFTTNQVAVVWDLGAWGLVYALDELMGAEVIVDGLVVGRVHRGEARRALDAFDAAERVALRLVFDDLTQPEFVLDLWLPEDEGRSDELPPGEAIAEANRWLARIEALLRRPVTVKRPPSAQSAAPQVSAPVAAEPTAAAAPEPPPPPLFAFRAPADADPPPWDEAEIDENDDEDSGDDRARMAGR